MVSLQPPFTAWRKARVPLLIQPRVVLRARSSFGVVDPGAVSELALGLDRPGCSLTLRADRARVARHETPTIRP